MPLPGLLIDTCSLINLSYCAPVATQFKAQYRERSGWAEAVRGELVHQRKRRPPHPQAGQACSRAVTWLPATIRVEDPGEMRAIEAIQNTLVLASPDEDDDHLGEAVSIYLLRQMGRGRLVSDDHTARRVARYEYRVKAISTVGVVQQWLSRDSVSMQTADLYLDTLRARRRMNAKLCAADLLANQLQSWQ